MFIYSKLSEISKTCFMQNDLKIKEPICYKYISSKHVPFLYWWFLAIRKIPRTFCVKEEWSSVSPEVFITVYKVDHSFFWGGGVH